MQTSARPPSRREVDASTGPVVLEFGTAWCGHCRRAQPLVADALRAHPQAQHVRIEDGPGQALGRSFGVKLWPTLVFLQDGQEVARLVRPDSAEPLQRAFAGITPQP
jgi:thioredoxin 1